MYEQTAKLRHEKKGKSNIGIEKKRSSPQYFEPSGMSIIVHNTGIEQLPFLIVLKKNY